MQIIQTKYYPNVCTNFKKFHDEMDQNRKKEDYAYGRKISEPVTLKPTEWQKWRRYQIRSQEFMQTFRRRRLKYPGWYTHGRMVQNQRDLRRHANLVLVRIIELNPRNPLFSVAAQRSFLRGGFVFEAAFFWPLPKESAGGLSFSSLRLIAKLFTHRWR